LAKEPFSVVVEPSAARELSAFRSFEQRRVTDEIRSNLLHGPFTPTRNRKLLEGVVPAFKHELPVWELRVGQLRVFYDGKAETRTIYIRAVREKSPGKTTEEITR
jgi:mRNA-degrading endonuclease RelE of RelBE toxin-antitoxin system